MNKQKKGFYCLYIPEWGYQNTPSLLIKAPLFKWPQTLKVSLFVVYYFILTQFRGSFSLFIIASVVWLLAPCNAPTF